MYQYLNPSSFLLYSTLLFLLYTKMLPFSVHFPVTTFFSFCIFPFVSSPLCLSCFCSFSFLSLFFKHTVELSHTSLWVDSKEPITALYLPATMTVYYIYLALLLRQALSRTLCVLTHFIFTITPRDRCYYPPYFTYEETET